MLEAVVPYLVVVILGVAKQHGAVKTEIQRRARRNKGNKKT